jgi:hypothetical protein
MSTNLEIVQDALEALGIIGETATPSAEQGSHALRKLNQMMEQWEEDGIKLGYFAQTDTTQDCPIPLYAERGVAASLAIFLAPTYGASVSAELADQADKGFQTILRKAVKPPEADMSHMPGAFHHWNIETDSF